MNLLPLAFAFVLTTILTYLAIRVFPMLGLLDRPQKYGLQRAPIPYFGGLAIFVSFLISVFIFLPFSREVLGLLTGLTLITVVSFLDDRLGLSPMTRLGAQILSALLLIISGIGITHITNPFGGIIDLAAYDWLVPFFGEHHLTLLADLFTIAWVILIINAINWFDGVPGLSSGVSGLGALAIFLLAVRPDFHYFDQSAVIGLASILAGAAFAFTLFNFPPPKILLGDTGSMPLGFILAGLAILSGAKIATALLVLGFPLLDAIWVTFYRIYKGRAPWCGGEWDRERKAVHLHHRLLSAGWSERQIALTIFTYSAIFGAIALYLDDAFGKFIALGVLALLIVVVSLGARKKIS